MKPSLEFKLGTKVNLQEIRAKMANRLVEAARNQVSTTEFNSLCAGGVDTLMASKAFAFASDLTEFKTLLDILVQASVCTKETAQGWLAHENAHMNVAEATGHQTLGYGVVLIDQGEKTGISPVCLSLPQPHWEAKEILEKRIKVLKAPEDYGEKLSDDDRTKLSNGQKHLQTITNLEEELRKLGINSTE